MLAQLLLSSYPDNLVRVLPLSNSVGYEIELQNKLDQNIKPIIQISSKSFLSSEIKSITKEVFVVYTDLVKSNFSEKLLLYGCTLVEPDWIYPNLKHLCFLTKSIDSSLSKLIISFI